MIFALNVYDVIPGKESLYADYATKAAAVAAALDVKFVAAGTEVRREIMGQTRNHFAVVEFQDIDAFDVFMQKLADEDLHKLREQATENYIWTLYDKWVFGD
jgi:uncharacterized protein (DUF1330 family)